MGIVGRMIAPGVVVSVHQAIPRGSGDGELGRSDRIPSAVFAERGDDTAVNVDGVEVTISRHGQARYVGIWIENRLRAQGQFRTPELVRPGDVLRFPRGDLWLEWP